MTEHARSLPKDIRARERLRAAQVAESGALAAVCSAESALSAARRRRDESVARADALVVRAEQKVATARAELVGVSGVERAARLLGLEKKGLRRARGSRGEPHSADGERDGAHVGCTSTNDVKSS